MNFEDEPYVRLYTTDTASWSLLGWEGQTVLMHMLRGRFDRAGVFDCGRHDPSRAVTGVTRLPADLVARGLAEILAEGTWVLNGNLIVWPNYVHAQTCARSDRLRQAESRRNRRDSALPVITEEDQEVSQNVTNGHDQSHVSQSVTPSLTVPSRAEQSGEARARTARVSAGERQELSLRMADPEDAQIFDAWRVRFQMTDAHLTADRALPLRARRAEDMTQQDALDALAGAETDDWFTRQGKKLKLIFNDRERFETYRNIGRDIRAGRPPPPKSGVKSAHRQPDSGYSPRAHAREIT